MSHEEDALTVEYDAARMDVTALSVGQNPGKKDLVGGKEGEGVEVAPAEGLLSLIVYPDVAIVMVKYR